MTPRPSARPDEKPARGHAHGGHAHAHGDERRGTTAHARERLSQWIAEKGLKATRQRDLIVDTFFDSPGHLSVDELLEAVTRRDAHVGAATVYRTMKILAECGLASARHFDDGQTRYEPALDRKHHDHLICTSCHAIVEFENERIEELQETVARHHGFTVTRHKLELYGLCKACQGRAGGAAGKEHR
jgi:Fur family ferric uptake transcriptional regulator